MASLHKTNSKTLPYQVRWREGGKQKKKSFRTAQEQKRFAAKKELEAGVQAQHHLDDPNITFQAYAEIWRKGRPGRVQTQGLRETNLRLHTYPVIGDRPLRALKHSELQALVTGWQMAPGSARTAFIPVRQVLRAAVRDGLIPRSPAEGVVLPEVDPTKVSLLTRAQVQAMAAALPPRYSAMVTVGAATGLRIGELLGLQVGDIDWDLNQLRVQRQVTRGSQVGPLKTRYSYRKVPLAEYTMNELRNHLQLFGGQQGDHIFHPEDKPVLTTQRADQLWRQARRNVAGVDGGWHLLRHTLASMLLFAGRGVKEVAEWLGHKDPTITLRVYAHLLPESRDLGRHAVDMWFQEPPQ